MKVDRKNGELIRRQSAIATADSMLQKCDGDINDYHDLMVEALEVLPSAQQKWHEFSKNELYIRMANAIEICMEQIESPINTYFEKGTAEIIKEKITELPSAEPDIIYCKYCRKHNKKVGFDENFHTVWKEDACPLVSWRGKAKGHEFDYQFCAFAERKTDDCEK